MSTETLNISTEIIDFEQGNLSTEGTIRLFQYLVDTGMAWTLQGFYGRTAARMIEAGLINPPTGGARRAL
jgi:hypothetical protein